MGGKKRKKEEDEGESFGLTEKSRKR